MLSPSFQLCSSTMSGPNNLFTDSFLNDGFNTPYNNNALFLQPERTVLNHAHASEVGFANFSTFVFY
jgi:hypothetical protein